MTRKSSGEVYAQIKAEAANPRADVWWGGTGDPHMQAAEEGLTDAYTSPKLAELNDWAVRQWQQAKGRTVGIYSGALGYGFNTKEIAGEEARRAEMLGRPPRSEAQGRGPGRRPELVRHRLHAARHHHPAHGRGEGLRLPQEAAPNVNQYTKSGAAPAKATALGETAVGITFMHDMVTMVVDGAPVKVVAPCEGTGYEIGSMSIVKGARNPDSAKRWYDWALSPAAQAIGATRQAVPDPVEQDGADLAAFAEARRDQAHRLRFRQIRLLRRAPPPALEMGRARSRAAEIG